LLPGALMRNARLKFLSRPVRVRVEATDTPFTGSYERGEELTLPIAHGDGRYVADTQTAAELEANGQVVLRYVTAPERVDARYRRRMQRRPQCGGDHAASGAPHAQLLGVRTVPASSFLWSSQCDAARWRMRAVDGRHLRV